MIHRHLFRNHRTFFFTYLCDIKFISKCTCQCHIRPGHKWRSSSNCMVRTIRHVGTHSRKRIYQFRSLLYRKSLDGIRVIGAPYLRTVVKHARVESCTTARAVLKQKIWKIVNKALLQLIYSKHIPVSQFSLPVSGEFYAADIRELSVHIPLNILNICG